MQNTSAEYKAAMQLSLRNRGYVLIYTGNISELLLENIYIPSNELTYYSDTSDVFWSYRKKDYLYATLEGGYSKVDGSMFFTPREETGTFYYDNGAVAAGNVDSNQKSISIKGITGGQTGITIDFGENYPTDFWVYCTGGSSFNIHISNNTNQVYHADWDLHGITQIEIYPVTMLHDYSRLRLHSVSIGEGFVVNNKDIKMVDLNKQRSPIGEYLPQVDATIELIDYENVLHEKFNIKDRLQIKYGYEVNGSVEWLPYERVIISDVAHGDDGVKIVAVDRLRGLTDLYYKGANDGTLYALATALLPNDNIADDIDTFLRNVYVSTPTPLVSNKELLQIIANSTGEQLGLTRYGGIQISNDEWVDYNNRLVLSKNDIMQNTLEIVKEEPVKEILLSKYSEDLSEEKKILSGEVTVTTLGEVIEFSWKEPHTQITVKINGIVCSATTGLYKARVVSESIGANLPYEITGKQIETNTTVKIFPVHQNGDTVEWDNPLYGHYSNLMLSDLLADYYSENTVYEFDYRGNPELDVGDIIELDLDDGRIAVGIEELDLSFNGAFSGHIKARKVSESWAG